MFSRSLSLGSWVFSESQKGTTPFHSSIFVVLYSTVSPVSAFWRLSSSLSFVAALRAPLWCCICWMERTGWKRPLSGKQLESLLLALSRGVEIVLERQAESELIPKKGKEESKYCVAKALKSHLCIGINSVSRTLERMPAKSATGSSLGEPEPKRAKIVDNVVPELETLGQQQHSKRANRPPLQVVIYAADVQPKSLVAHLGVLCASRGVAMLPISGGDGSGSLKLGEVLGTRTAIAIGIKEGDTPINWAVESILESESK